MKITRTYLKKIIQEEMRDGGFDDHEEMRDDAPKQALAFDDDDPRTFEEFMLGYLHDEENVESFVDIATSYDGLESAIEEFNIDAETAGEIYKGVEMAEEEKLGWNVIVAPEYLTSPEEEMGLSGRSLEDYDAYLEEMIQEEIQKAFGTVEENFGTSTAGYPKRDEYIYQEKKKKKKKKGKKKRGKDCAESEGGSGCIKKDPDGDGWVIWNNKKGGVFKHCDSKKDCEDVLSVPGVHKESRRAQRTLKSKTRGRSK